MHTLRKMGRGKRQRQQRKNKKQSMTKAKSNKSGTTTTKKTNYRRRAPVCLQLNLDELRSMDMKTILRSFIKNSDSTKEIGQQTQGQPRRSERKQSPANKCNTDLLNHSLQQLRV